MSAPSWLNRLYTRVGRRGLVLLAFAVLFVLNAVFTASGPHAPVAGVVHTLVPPVVQGIIYLAGGIIAAATAFRLGVHATTPGFIGLALPLTLEGTSWVAGSVLWLVTAGTMGTSQGWLGGIQALFYLTLLLIVASWPEESPPVDLDGDAPPALTGSTDG